MPGVDIETVTLDESIDHPLDAVLAQVDRSKAGPVMIVGLERVASSDTSDHPVLSALNLSRPDWPKELHRPLVLWVPDYLLGLMGREAPDFLDWRSDTLFFPESVGEVQLVFSSRPWSQSQLSQLPEAQRRSRVAELRSRLAGRVSPEDPVISAAHSSWLRELAIHLSFLGNPAEAADFLREALDIERSLARPGVVAEICETVGGLRFEQGDLEGARLMLERALEIRERIGPVAGLVSALANLALVHVNEGDLDKADSLARRALELALQENRLDLLPSAYIHLSLVANEQGELRRAAALNEEALVVSEKIGDRISLSKAAHNLGVLALNEGDLAKAEKFLLKSVDMERLLGHKSGLAMTLTNLGRVSLRKDQFEDAARLFEEASTLYNGLGDTARAKLVRSYIREGNAPLDPSSS